MQQLIVQRDARSKKGESQNEPCLFPTMHRMKRTRGQTATLGSSNLKNTFVNVFKTETSTPRYHIQVGRRTPPILKSEHHSHSTWPGLVICSTMEPICFEVCVVVQYWLENKKPHTTQRLTSCPAQRSLVFLVSCRSSYDDKMAALLLSLATLRSYCRVHKETTVIIHDLLTQ